MKSFSRCTRIAVFVLLVSVIVLSETVPLSASEDQFPSTSWAALAYSKSTQNLGWASGKSSRDEAERIALDYCDAPDAVVLTSTTLAHLTFARGCNGSYGWATNNDREEAESLAVSNCRRHCQHAHLSKTVCNGHSPSY
jgi:hypothetical protein